jgi:hypothetical protein
MDFVAPFTCPPRKPVGDCHAQVCDGLYRDRVNAHVLYQTPPLHYSQNNRTLFSNDFVWEQAYIYLSEQVQQLQCNLSAGVGTEAARTLNLHYNSVQCTAANAQGVCTAWYNVPTSTVRIVMRVVQNGLNGHWIVYNAYPVR